MAIKSDIRQAARTAGRELKPATSEQQLLAEIDRLRREVDRLSDELQGRPDHPLDLEIQTVLSSLTNPPATLDPSGRRLTDGRYIPRPVVDGGTSAPAEPGAPRVAADRSCEFAEDDESAAAFDQFFNAPDPHLDKIRRFLID